MLAITNAGRIMTVWAMPLMDKLQRGCQIDTPPGRTQTLIAAILSETFTQKHCGLPLTLVRMRICFALSHGCRRYAFRWWLGSERRL